MKRKIMAATFAVCMLFASAAFAATSSTYITSTMTGADGCDHSMAGNVTTSGQNYDSSTEDLWVELYRSVSGPDTRISGSMMAVGGNTSFSNNVASGTYYVHLDPDGPNYTGCNGYGQSVN